MVGDADRPEVRDQGGRDARLHPDGREPDRDDGLVPGRARADAALGRGGRAVELLHRPPPRDRGVGLPLRVPPKAHAHQGRHDRLVRHGREDPQAEGLLPLGRALEARDRRRVRRRHPGLEAERPSASPGGGSGTSPTPSPRSPKSTGWSCGDDGDGLARPVRRGLPQVGPGPAELGARARARDHAPDARRRGPDRARPALGHGPGRPGGAPAGLRDRLVLGGGLLPRSTTSTRPCSRTRTRTGSEGPRPSRSG